MRKFKNTLSLVLSLSVATAAMPGAASAAGESSAETLETSVVYGMLLLTTLATGILAVTGFDDTQAAESLLDQAYAGAGEKLETLAGASGKSVEAVAETIVGLERDGLISTDNPKAMAEAVAAALVK